MIKVDAQPLCRRGEFAVWDVMDIPAGIKRHTLTFSVIEAIENTRTYTVTQTEKDRDWARVVREASTPAFSAVRWSDLQPLHDPRGRESMTAEQWGVSRDVNGTCRVCAADDSMWCDTVAHAQAERPIVGSSVAITPSNHPTMEPDQSGVPSPRDRPEFVEHALQTMGAASGETIDRRNTSPEHRALWAAALRERVQASAHRERNRVLVDLEIEP